MLHELIRQLDTGLVYDRDLGVVAEAVDELVGAIGRRTRYRNR